MKTFYSVLFALVFLVTSTNAIAAEAQNKAMAPSTSASTAMAGQPVLLDAVLVSVGEEIILFSDLQKAVKLASSGQTVLEPGGKLRGGAIGEKETQQLLEQLTDQRILALRVREMNLNVSDDELESEIQTFLKNQNVTKDQFMEMLKTEGETYSSYREEFRKQLETQRFVGRVIRPLVSVSEDEVRNFYLQQTGVDERAQKIKLRSLMINMPSDLTEVQKQTKNVAIANIKKEVASDADFAELVKLYSEAPDAIKTGGLLPPKSPKELPAEVWKKIKETKQNGVVGPITIGSAVFFFQYLGTDVNNLADFEKQKSQLENRLLETKFQERLNEYLKAERAKTKISRTDIKIYR